MFSFIYKSKNSFLDGETSMSEEKQNHAAIIGAGVIGLSWASLLLAKGWHVRIHSPNRTLSKESRDLIHSSILEIPGYLPDKKDPLAHLESGPDLRWALENATIVQENSPENLELKQDLFAAIEKVAKPEAILLSSTSGIMASMLGKKMAHPERVMVGHPINPPHLVPLIELVPSAATPAKLVESAAQFYRSVDRVPVTLRKESPGFVFNRLQAAFFAQCIHLVADGVVTMEELDKIVTHSVGIRFISTGPFLALHKGGGTHGLRGYFSRYAKHLMMGWAHMKSPDLTPELIEKLSVEADSTFGVRSAGISSADENKILAKVVDFFSKI